MTANIHNLSFVAPILGSNSWFCRAQKQLQRWDRKLSLKFPYICVLEKNEQRTVLQWIKSVNEQLIPAILPHAVYFIQDYSIFRLCFPAFIDQLLP